MSAPGAGRSCPLHYRYRPRQLAGQTERRAATLYLVGGLYGNLPALDALEGLVRAEPGPVSLVFNGDFNWFNLDPSRFLEVNQRVLAHHALRGNVETELAAAGETAEAGCGCAYPDWVDADTVTRSNAIMARLRRVGGQFPELLARLEQLAPYARYRVAGLAVAVVHGDAESLAGWGFAQEHLSRPGQAAAIEDWFDQARVQVFASSHTCLPVLARFAKGVLVNNGAAGMPNFAGTGYGVVSRIAASDPPVAPLYGLRLGRARIDAMALHYDRRRWLADFEADWPQGSPAHLSYYRRLVEGPDYSLSRAVRSTSAGSGPGPATTPRGGRGLAPQ